MPGVKFIDGGVTPVTACTVPVDGMAGVMVLVLAPKDVVDASGRDC